MRKNVGDSSKFALASDSSGGQAVSIPQYSIARVLGVWAIAAVPMGLAAWVLAPALAGMWPGETGFAQGLLLSLTLGLMWQALVVAVSIYREQGTLRWPVIREALWLQAPYDPRRKLRSPPGVLPRQLGLVFTGCSHGHIQQCAGPRKSGAGFI